MECPLRSGPTVLDGRAVANRRGPLTHRPRDGGAERTSMRRLAGGLLAHWPPWFFQLLRGLHSHRGFDVQSARQVAQGHASYSLAPPHRFAELFAQLARVAAGP